jgi:hypothetical protein
MIAMNHTELKKKILLVIVSSAFTIAVAGPAAEVYLRWQQKRPITRDYALEFDTHRGQKVSDQEGRLKLSLAPFTVYKNLPSQRTSAFSVNSRGLRADENAERDPSSKILFLGGSAAFGQGAGSNEETIPYILERSTKPHRVLNAGVIGFLSGQELTYLVTDLVDYGPSVVVAYDGWNDLYDAVYARAGDNGELGFNHNFFGLEDQLLLNYQTQVSPFKSLSRLVEVTSKKSLLLTLFAQSLQASPAPRPGIRKDRLDSIVSSYARNLRKMAVFSRACGARFIVVFQPELGQKQHPTEAEQRMLANGIDHPDYREEFVGLYRLFLTKAKQQLARDGIEWLDINENPKYLESTDALFVDVVHTNRRGNELVADIIGPQIRALTNSSIKTASEAR